MGREWGHPQPLFFTTPFYPRSLNARCTNREPTVYQSPALHPVVTSCYLTAMSISSWEALSLKHGFVFLRRMRDEGVGSFSAGWRAIGCYPKSMALMVKDCLAAGLISRTASRGYELTDKGFRALALWEQLLALDGEPAGAGRMIADKTAEWTRLPVEDSLAKARAVLAAGPVKVTHRGVAPPPVGERFVELDEDADLDPFGPGGSES